MKAKKSWREKLATDNGLPIVKPIPPRMIKRSGDGTIAIPSPREVDEIMRSVPKSRLITPREIGAKVAANHRATIGCTVTSGIFAWIAAHAANEDEMEGKKKFTPYWRALKSGGELNPKFPGGVENLKQRLEAEGHVVIQKGPKYFVENYEKKLVSVA
jgi:hypothetical protein